MHFCGSVITHYDTFSRRLQSAVGSPEGLSEGDCGSCGSRSGLRSNKGIPHTSQSHRPCADSPPHGVLILQSVTVVTMVTVLYTPLSGIVTTVTIVTSGRLPVPN